MFYLGGRIKAMLKLGMDTEVNELTKQLESAVKDEVTGRSDYLDMAEEAEDAKKPKVEAMARSHAKDELKHYTEDSSALSEMN